MKARSLFAAAVCAIASSNADVAQAFSISAVTLSPSNVVPPLTELRMTIDIVTPSQGTWLYAPTQISSNATGLHVDVYPTSGPLTAIGALRETVTLGVFPPGTHQYEVVIHPGFTVGWGLRTNRGSFTVQGPLVSISGISTVLEYCPPNADCAGISFSLRRTGPRLDQPLTVFLLYEGTATADADYQRLPIQVTFEAGREFTYVSSIPIDDTLYEGDETIVANVIQGLDYYADPNQRQATTILRDNEPAAPPIVSLELVDPFAQETRIDQNAILWAEFTVSRTGPTTEELLVYLNSEQGTARFGEDYRLYPVVDGSTVRIPAGARSTNMRLYPIDDDFYEGDETVRVTLIAPPSGSKPYQIDNAHSSVDIVIRDNDPVTPRPVVSIEATQEIAEESSYPLRRLALRGLFTISRTGPVANPLSVFVHYSGTAMPSADYPALPFLVSIPAGAASTALEIVPHDDGVPEGIETLVATLSHCPPETDPPLGIPCYGGFEIDPARGQATVFIRDDGITQASVAIIRPADGASFSVGQTIPIEAIALDLEGYISRVEFWDGPTRVAVSEIVFIRAPDPGTPIYHSFDWRDATAGDHVLTAQAVTANGVALISQPVRITVEPTTNRLPRSFITQPVNGEAFPPDTPIEIVAEAHDADGYVPKMEFFADGRKIGESTIVFIRPPDPGQTQTFSFVWRQPPPGPHTLTVRPTDDRGATTTSAPVDIIVGGSEPLPIVVVTAPDCFAVEPSSNSTLNTATFRIRRFGPTNDALVVAYSLHGTAINGTDYETLPGLVIIPAGSRSVQLIVRPLADNLSEGTETVRLRLEEPPPPSPEIRVINPYHVGRPSSAAAVISDHPWVPSAGAARCASLSDGGRHVCFAAEAGRNFCIEASGDLRNWETLFDSVCTDGAWHFVDTEDQPRRFYRLRPEPVQGDN